MAWNPRISRYLCAIATVALLVASFIQAQTLSTADPDPGSIPQTIPQTIADALRQISDKAGVIFVGEVVAIRPHDDGNFTSGFIEINFRVDQAVLGCTSGGTYTLREWAGLWSGNDRRYQVGQHLLMVLRSPGASGMSSPVGGMDGAIPIRGGGVAPLANDASTLSQISIVDLRWLGATLLHPASYTLHSTMAPTPLTVLQQTAPASSRNLSGESIANSFVPEDSSSRASVPLQQASVGTVVKLLSSWQKVPHDVR
ncbi:MAG: hypothetical protein ABI380_03750 [Edaphobacter sp.]